MDPPRDRIIREGRGDPVTSREDVLAAADGLRTPDPSAQAEKALASAIRRIVADLITVDSSAGDLLDWTAYPAVDDGALDGVMIDATTYAYASGVTRTRSIIAVVPADETAALIGTIELRASGASLLRSRLDGDMFVSSPIDTTDAGSLEVRVTDDVTRPLDDPPAPPAPAPVPRTAAEKAAAKQAYDKAVKKARKKYAKAKKKAGSSKRKKTAAKKKYARSRATAKAKYRAAVADVPPAAAPGAPADTRVFRTTISTDTGWAAVA